MTFRTTLGTLFAAIVKLIGLITRSVDVAEKAVDFVDTGITRARDRQIAREIDVTAYRRQYLAEKSAELAEARMVAESYADKSPKHQKYYDAALAELEAAMKE